MNHARSAYVAALALLAVAAIAGCGETTKLAGGATGSSGAGARRLTVAAWKHRVSGICSAMTRRSEALPKPKTSAQVLPFVRQVVAAGDAEVARLKALAPPPQFAAGQRHVVADLTSIFGKLGSLASKRITAVEFVAALRTPAFQRAAADYVARSKAAGLTSCVLAPGT